MAGVLHSGPPQDPPAGGREEEGAEVETSQPVRQRLSHDVHQAEGEDPVRPRVEHPLLPHSVHPALPSYPS